MGDNSKIEWTDATWNPIVGCSVVSPGCTNCYAMRLAGTRLRHTASREGLTVDSNAGPVWNGEVRLVEQWLRQPSSWRAPRRIFVCAHGDLFHPKVPTSWIDKVWSRMALTPRHTYQVLTKRADRMRDYVRGLTYDHRVTASSELMMAHALADEASQAPRQGSWVLPNVWLGVSAEDQLRADQRIPLLLTTPATTRFVSIEPMLGPVNLDSVQKLGMTDDMGNATRFNALRSPLDTFGRQATPAHAEIDWVICGGESGPGARPMHPDWASALRDQCAAAGVPYFFKQWGSWAPVCAMSSDATERCYHPAPQHSPEASRRCKVENCVLHADGERFDGNQPGAYAADSKAMMMMNIGKHAAGALLDGKEWRQFPEIDNTAGAAG